MRQASWASAPDLALHAKEAAQRIGAHLPTFPESEDSDELSERMRLLSMSHCQVENRLAQGSHCYVMPHQAQTAASTSHPPAGCWQAASSHCLGMQIHDRCLGQKYVAACLPGSTTEGCICRTLFEQVRICPGPVDLFQSLLAHMVQGMESLLQQQFQQRPQQLSSSGPASRGLQDLQYALSSSYGLPPLSMGPDLAHAHTAGGYLPLQAAVPRQSYQGLGEARAPPQAPLQQFHSVPNHVGAQQQEQHWSNAMNRLLHEAPQAGMAGADVLAMRSLSEGMPPSHPHRGLPYSLSSDQHMLLQVSLACWH